MILNSEQEQVRAFAQAELWPHAARWDKEHHFPVAGTSDVQKIIIARTL